MYGKSNTENYITICKYIANGNFLYESRNSNRGWYQARGVGWGGEGDGREALKGGDICITWLIHVEILPENSKIL